MSEAENLYHRIAQDLEGVESSKMFGKLCLKAEGKAFVAFFQDEMVFKLSGKDHDSAMALKGAKSFDPSGKGRPMKEWIQVPFVHADLWNLLADRALFYRRSEA